MSHLETLKKATSLTDVAHVLGYQPAGLSFILYKIPDATKYVHFQIPKRGGGLRQIKAPIPQLKAVQRRLANVLYNCWSEIEAHHPEWRPLSHGFSRGRSIISNAYPHRNRRFVLNLDLRDFFQTINFGRVRGFFMNDKAFALPAKVATVVAQIACHENGLPQGSPCSPIVSNLVGHLLDARLVRLAKANTCSYTRYADDITLSTNRKEFPPELAFQCDGVWVLGTSLVDVIQRTGFAINDKKTRVQCRPDRQLVTGLTVNRKVNVRASYYRAARAMAHSVFTKGDCVSPINHSIGKTADGKQPVSREQLAGILSHVYAVKDSSDVRDRTEKKKRPTAFRTLYRRYLFHQTFVDNHSPLIVCEGKTDNAYLKLAIQKRAVQFPELGKMGEKSFDYSVSFFGYGRGKKTDGNAKRDVLQITGGIGHLKFLVIDYKRFLSTFPYAPLRHPVIILVDNDSGGAEFFGVTKNYGAQITLATKSDFYHIHANLYVVKTPELDPTGESCIENCFDAATLALTLDGKPFNLKNPDGGDSEISKSVFAEQVIRPKADTIEFSGFDPLLKRISAVLTDYETRKPKGLL